MQLCIQLRQTSVVSTLNEQTGSNLGACALSTLSTVGAETIIQTGIRGTVVDNILTVTASPATSTHTLVIVNKLHTVYRARINTRVRQALVDITFTALPSKTVRTMALKASHKITTYATMIAGSIKAVILVNLTQQPQSTTRTGTTERVDKIMALASMLTRISGTVVNVVLTVHSLP